MVAGLSRSSLSAYSIATIFPNCESMLPGRSRVKVYLNCQLINSPEDNLLWERHILSMTTKSSCLRSLPICNDYFLSEDKSADSKCVTCEDKLPASCDVCLIYRTLPNRSNCAADVRCERQGTDQSARSADWSGPTSFAQGIDELYTLLLKSNDPARVA